jgi:hypothetical protein
MSIKRMNPKPCPLCDGPATREQEQDGPLTYCADRSCPMAPATFDDTDWDSLPRREDAKPLTGALGEPLEGE